MAFGPTHARLFESAVDDVLVAALNATGANGIASSPEVAIVNHLSTPG